MSESAETIPVKLSYKRRKLLINAKVQIIFLIYGVGLALFTLWGASAVSNSSMSVPIAFGLCIGFSIFILAGIYLSNLIVGPVYRLMSHMEAINQGKEVTELTFRNMDFFQEILPTYNQFAKTLQNRTQEK